MPEVIDSNVPWARSLPCETMTALSMVWAISARRCDDTRMVRPSPAR